MWVLVWFYLEEIGLSALGLGGLDPVQDRSLFCVVFPKFKFIVPKFENFSLGFGGSMHF